MRPAGIENPKPRREWIAPDCTMCANLRPEGKCYSRVYATKPQPDGSKKRYVRCHFCNHVWTMLEPAPFAAIDKESKNESEKTDTG